jgi:MoaA/NifB/PqqE/SkfB family radical SAM enzyme
MEKTPELSTREVYKLLDNLGNSSITVLSIEGGDPLMRKDLGEILEYAHTKPFLLFFTTDGLLIDKRPMKDYGKHIDFLHISIDEGHENLDYFDRLNDFQKFGPPICVQIVVTKYTLSALEEKVKKVYEVGARTVVMPATHLSNTDNVYPDPKKFAMELRRLKKKYKNTITTSYGFLKNINKLNGCSTSSIIIDSDGGLYYPCRMLGDKPYNLTTGDLLTYLRSEDAKSHRAKMKFCRNKCGWYQYFATDSFVSPLSFIQSLRPYLTGLR